MPRRATTSGVIGVMFGLAATSCDRLTPRRTSTAIGKRTTLVTQVGTNEISLVGEAQRRTTSGGCDRSGWVSSGEWTVLAWSVETQAPGSVSRRWHIEETVASTEPVEQQLARASIVERCQAANGIAFRMRAGSVEIPGRRGKRFVRVVTSAGGGTTVETVPGASCADALSGGR